MPSEPAFLPSTMSATVSSGAQGLRRSAEQANAAAAECWAALLGGCDSPGRRLLPGRLKDLAAATASYAGTAWWFGDGSRHRWRIAQAQARIEEAVAERDGAEFAEAFVGYDEAVATAVVSVGSLIK